MGCRGKKERRKKRIQNDLRNLLYEDCIISLKTLSITIYDEFSIQFGQTTIFRCLDDIHFSLKSVRAIPEKRNVEHTILVRKAYAESFTLIEEQFASRNIILSKLFHE
ncbi:hypothetical protein RF11_09973 [Thelohanellus kitauei]|uniref:Uncharacterized protein n=1 Tax=Thelohanellus kitauei TaxID=669202 RepID=A0A0C2N335_THEKT|nr:hypothetical protein RF11_09973 [Thelohanellus kitauei]